ncbi:hypothetical protein F5Y04DRAFT_274250 [Hypomontagnella monticulosa]|nr:hypothetical protein F5Y04DRAFT_274250 [Hypomontagnella monticulosa]
MQFSLLFLAPLASLLQLGAALPAEPNAPALKVQKIAIPLNETRYWAELQSGDKEGLAKRDSCSSATPYSDSDMDALINSLYNDGETDYLPATGSLGYYIGTAIVCVYNTYIFENTHVSHWEMGWGADYIKGQCCPSESDNPQCAGGSCIGKGDSGLKVQISTHNSASHC